LSRGPFGPRGAFPHYTLTPNAPSNAAQSVNAGWVLLFIWFIWFVLFIWLNQPNRRNQMNQINQTNQMNQSR